MLRPWMITFLTTILVGVSFPLSAQAVYTKRCPSQISLHFSAHSLVTEQELRDNPRHTAFTEAMFQDVLRSQKRFEDLVVQDLAKTDFVLAERKDGKCFYHGLNALFQSAHLILFTSAGVDYLKEEVRVKRNLVERQSERFSVQAALSSYSTTEVVLASEPAELFTTVQHGCYDSVCISDVSIGHGKLKLEIPPTH
jgi:hypothetical protein